MTRLTINCERGDGWWVAQCVEEPGLITQARRLDQIPDMVKDAATLFDEFEPEDLDIALVVEGELGEGAHRVRLVREEADKAQERASQVSREYARELSSQGVSFRDIGQLLGVSYQYAQKLARS